jgi:hypothetical protein
MSLRYLALAGLFAACTFHSSAAANELKGPGRFCGYSPIIDLLEGETITTLQGGIHGGSFRWKGAFGTLEVYGIGWAGRPPGEIVRQPADGRPGRFEQRREDGDYVVAIWNGEYGAAYFRSEEPLTSQQIEAIDRVALFNEGETPEGCKLRTVFSWE